MIVISFTIFYFFFIKKASISSITQYFHSLGKVENVFPSIWTLIDGPFGTGQPRGTKAQGQTEKLGHFRVASSLCFTAVSDNTRPAMSKTSLDFGFFCDVSQNLEARGFYVRFLALCLNWLTSVWRESSLLSRPMLDLTMTHG